jgi:hypothetical protein
MQRFLCAAAISLAANAVLAQTTVEATPKTIKLISPPYASITLVSIGPAYGHEQPLSEQVRGRFNRLVALRNGLVYDHPLLRIETLTYGHEGCCSRLVTARQLDLNALVESGLRLPEATSSEIESIQWASSDNVTLRYGTYSCQLIGLNKPKVVVSCKP